MMKIRLPAFDVLVDMARNDPQGLETLRRSLTEAVISTATSDITKRRLEGLQFRVDMERERAVERGFCWEVSVGRVSPTMSNPPPPAAHRPPHLPPAPKGPLKGYIGPFKRII